MAIAVHGNADTFSSNATKPFQLVPIAYNGDGNVRAMGNISAGLPNMSALVHCHLCHELIKVANHPYNKHHSSHYTKIGALQIPKDTAGL